MSNFISYLADLTDPTFATKEVNLNAYEVGTGPFETDPDSFDLGSPDLNGVWLSEDGKDEDVLSAHRRGRVAASFDLRIGPSSTNTLANLTLALQRLNRALDRSGVWVVQQPGLSYPVYVDYYPSPLMQQLMPGERSLYYLWSALQQPNGMRITIVRRPKMRLAGLSADVNLAHNPLMAEDHNADGRPTFWSWDSETGLSAFSYDWTFGAADVVLATASTRFFSQDADDDAVVEGESFTFAIDVAAVRTLLPSVRARIDWLDNVGSVIGSPVLGTAVSLLFTPSLGFSRPSVSGVAPSGAVGARYGLQITDQDTASVHLWVRNTQFEMSAAASTFRPGFEVVSNDATEAFGKRIWLTNDHNAEALVRLRATPDDDENIAAMTYSRRSGERDSAMAMRILPGWDAVDSSSLLHGTTAVSGEAKTSLDDDVMKSVLRHEVLQAEQSALKGAWRMNVAIRGNLNDAYQFELRYGFGDVPNLPRVASRLQGRARFDLTGPPASSEDYLVDLGVVRVPADSPGLFMELWAMRETTDDGAGTGELFVDQFWPEPIDDDVYASVAVPGATRPGGDGGGGSVTESTLGKDLVTPPDGLADDPDSGDPMVAGSVYNNDMLLNDTLEAAGLRLGATTGLDIVRHTYIAKVVMFTRAEDSGPHKDHILPKTHGELRVHDLTTDTQVVKVNVRNDAGIAWQSKAVQLHFTPVFAHDYLVYAIQTVANAIGNFRIEKIQHSYVKPIGDGGGPSDHTIAIDGDQRQAYVLNASDEFLVDLTPPAPPPVIRPRIQLYRVSFAGLGPNGSDDVLDGGPALLHDKARTARVGFHLIPRTYN